MRVVRKVAVTLVVGLVLLGAVAAVTLAHTPSRVVHVGVSAKAGAAILAIIKRDVSVCQPGETLPAGVSSIRLGIWAFYGVHVHVRVYGNSGVLAEGSRGPDWTSDTVTVPVKPLAHSTSNAELCFAIGPNSQSVLLRGAEPQRGEQQTNLAAASNSDIATPQAAHKEKSLLKGRVGVEYLATGNGDWYSRISSVIRHIGFGRSYSGPWIALLLLVLMGAVGALAVRLTLRELP